MKGGGGTLGFLAVCPSVSPLGVRPLGFPNFSQSSFEILTWNFVYDFVLTWYRSSLTFVSVHLLLLELLPFPKSPSTRFCELFSVILWDIDLKFRIQLCLDMIQIKFDFCLGWPTFTSVIALCKNVRPLGFPNFLTLLPFAKINFSGLSSSVLWYWLDIWYIN